jgi:hypothetical protein
MAATTSRCPPARTKNRMPGSIAVETQRLTIAPGYTGVIGQRGKWWIGWIDEIAGVNSQARTRDELIENLGSALEETLEMR